MTTEMKQKGECDVRGFLLPAGRHGIKEIKYGSDPSQYEIGHYGVVRYHDIGQWKFHSYGSMCFTEATLRTIAEFIAEIEP